MADTYLTTSASLLYACPQILRISIKINPTTTPSIVTTVTAMQTARRAARALLAPSSFDTRVLQQYKQRKVIRTYVHYFFG